MSVVVKYLADQTRSWSRIFVLILGFHFSGVSGLNYDGNLLLSFKYSVSSDPLWVLRNWDEKEMTPCQWNGIRCRVLSDHEAYPRVVSLLLPACRLLGTIPAELGMIEHLRTIDLSNNSINGSIPYSFFQNIQLRRIDLSNNMMSGEFPSTVTGQSGIVFLNFSDNGLTGTLPDKLGGLSHLQVLSLRNNYFTGSLPSAGSSIRVMDLSSNFLNGSLPSFFGGESLVLLNVSSNRLSGEIPPSFSQKIPGNATLDLSYNSLTGKVPDMRLFHSQDVSSLSGNPSLCGEMIKVACAVPSSMNNQDLGLHGAPSFPAIAAIPITTGSVPEPSPDEKAHSKHVKRFRKTTVAGIVIGDIAAFSIIAAGFLCIMHKRNSHRFGKTKTVNEKQASLSPASSITLCPCLRKKVNDGESPSAVTESDEEKGEDVEKLKTPRETSGDTQTLVTINGDKVLELETLLKASAFMLGSSGSNVIYKAVLEDGTVFAVRRIAECSVHKLNNFEVHVRQAAKLLHPNLVTIRGFYWSSDDKLIISDFVPNGSLADGRHRKTSPYYIPWQSRIKIAKGMARGLAFLHEKRHVHGNLKPSKVLLGLGFEAKICDFGLECLLPKTPLWRSMRNFGSKRSTTSKESARDESTGLSPSPCSSIIGPGSPYLPPESLRNLKPNTKWDVYSFGVLFLELLTGKTVTVDGQHLHGTPGLLGEERNRVLRMADTSIRVDIEGKEDVLLACFKLGLSCASPVPQNRPSMREALQVLERIPTIPSHGYN